MKIAVVGCGAVGSYYGAQLARAGQEVHFLLRSDYEVVRRQGVQIRSGQGDFRVRPQCARTPEAIGSSDLVLVAIKTTANAELPTLLPPLVGSQTLVLTLQNGLGNEERIAGMVSPDRILGGLCFVCLNRLEPGLIHHIDHGLVILGDYQQPAQPRTYELAELFRRARFPCDVAENLAQAHWEKLTWNIPFNGLGVAGTAGFEAVLRGELQAGVPLSGTLTTDVLLSDARWERLVRELIFEVIHAGRALGFNISDALADKQIGRTRTMGAYKASTLIDYERGLPLELDSIFFEPLRQAKAAGVAVPRLDALCRVLARLDAHATG